MLKITLALLAVALAGTASAAGWRSLRVDASSETAFEQSLAQFMEELNAPRRHVFGEALKDIWVAGSLAAGAEEREYTAAEYYRALDGLTYEQVVEFTDATGKTAKNRYRAAVAAAVGRTPGGAQSAPSWGQRPANGWGMNSASFAQAQQQCRCAAPNGPQGN
jgi:hypothetical protein